MISSYFSSILAKKKKFWKLSQVNIIYQDKVEFEKLDEILSNSLFSGQECWICKIRKIFVVKFTFLQQKGWIWQDPPIFVKFNILCRVKLNMTVKQSFTHQIHHLITRKAEFDKIDNFLSNSSHLCQECWISQNRENFVELIILWRVKLNFIKPKVFCRIHYYFVDIREFDNICFLPPLAFPRIPEIFK